MSKFRHTLGVIIGTISASIFIFLLEYANMKLFYPLPQGYTMDDMHDQARATEVLSKMPAGAFVSILIIYAITSMIGGIIASIISGKMRSWPAIITGVLLGGMGLWDNMMLKAPTWYTISAVIVSILFAFIGFQAVKKKTID